MGYERYSRKSNYNFQIIEAVEIKIHSNFDDRDIKTGEVINRAEFSNLLKEMVRFMEGIIG